MNELPSLPCYLNGEFTALKDAKISVMDRGFIFGDGVYEVVPVYGGGLFRFAQHMARLDRSLAELRIANPLTQAQWREVAARLIADYARSTGAKAENSDQLIYIQVTRGVAMREHVMLDGLTPTVFVMSNEMKPVPPELRSQGAACVTASDFRWEKAHIKSTSLLGAVFARQISYDAGALETVMFRHGFLSEAAASNVWVVKGGTVIGSPKDNLVLEGIRYGLIEEICRAQGIGFELRRLSRDEVLHADELLLSSATKEVLAITRLDGQAVGSGVPGPVYARLYAGYQQAKIAQSHPSQSAAPTPTMTTPPESPQDLRKDSLIEYPCPFPIKVMGAKVDGFVQAITRIAEQFDPSFDAATVELRDSKAGNYLGITVTVTATSREQLDELYRTLSTHPMVKMVL